MKIYDLKVWAALFCVLLLDSFLYSVSQVYHLKWLRLIFYAILFFCAAIALVILAALIRSGEAKTRYEKSELWFVVGFVLTIAGGIVHLKWFPDSNVWLFMIPAILVSAIPIATIYFLFISKIAYALPLRNNDMKRLTASALLSFVISYIFLSAIYTNGAYFKYYDLLNENRDNVLALLGVFTVFTYFTDRIVENYEDVINEPMMSDSEEQQVKGRAIGRKVGELLKPLIKRSK